MPYAAIPLVEDEIPHQAVCTFMHTAKLVGVGFKRLLFLGTMDIGARKFIRFQTTCPTHRIETIAGEMGRGYITPGDDGTYRAVLSCGRTTFVPSSVMQAVPLPGMRRMYRGTGTTGWGRQFLDLKRGNTGPL